MTRLPRLLRKALTQPPHRSAMRVAEIAYARVRGMSRRWADRAQGTFLPQRTGATWRGGISIAPWMIPADRHEALCVLGESALQHRFDLLGSRPVEVTRGMACEGFLGRTYAPGPAPVADAAGNWLAEFVIPSNLDASRALWRRIRNRDYRPIDWQIDFRSGYRWRDSAHISELGIPLDIGADIKVPWELGRLQHLPVLALCAILTRSGDAGFASASTYVGEIHDQLMDFLAQNPPRFGVQWLCPMDVGIRAANIILTVDLLAGAGLGLAQDVIDIVIRSVREHVLHISEYLEWDAGRRGNHYLANLVGLLWGACRLPSDPQIDSLFAFAAAELLHEGIAQFGEDGGNCEGSTNYHRLSGELILFGVALIAGAPADELARIDRADRSNARLHAPWRVDDLERRSSQERAAAFVPPALVSRLYRAGELTRAVTRPDGRVVQIGDNDSGRLFKLGSSGRVDSGPNGRVFVDDPQDHRPFIDAVHALFDAPETVATIDGLLVGQIAAGRTFAPPASVHCPDFGSLDDVIAAIAVRPSSRCRTIALPHLVSLSAWRRVAFRGFGIYTFSTDRHFIAFRCAPKPPDAAPSGHRHDDNLGIEYVIGDQRRIDPGTYCYTPSVQHRDRYRSAAAHDVPRAEAWDVAAPGEDMFGLHHAGWAECLAWQQNGVAGQIATEAGRVVRAIRISAAEVEIWDAVDPPDQLRDVGGPVAVADGYGIVRR